MKPTRNVEEIDSSAVEKTILYISLISDPERSEMCRYPNVHIDLHLY